MKLALGWRWPQGAGLAYCVKAAAATLLGYLLSFGGAENAVYGAFSAALIVGASRGEDVSTGANRVRGSLAGMLAGIALTYSTLPPALSVAVGIGATAYLCMGCGWGVPAARIGASLCAVTVLMHGQDALGYGVIRIANTLIGIAAGLAVSYLVLPVRGRDAVERASNTALVAVGNLLDALAHSDEPPPRPCMWQFSIGCSNSKRPCATPATSSAAAATPRLFGRTYARWRWPAPAPAH